MNQRLQEKPAIDLEDLSPQPGTFALSKTGKTYTIRAMTLDDHVWLVHECGDKEAVAKLFSEDIDVETISKLIYRMLEDKSDFPAQDVEEFDDEGEKERRRVSGPEVLRKTAVWPHEFYKMVSALAKSIGVSQPVDVEVKSAGEEKKKAASKKGRTGARSSTKSRTPTAGRKKNS